MRRGTFAWLSSTLLAVAGLARAETPPADAPPHEPPEGAAATESTDATPGSEPNPAAAEAKPDESREGQASDDETAQPAPPAPRTTPEPAPSEAPQATPRPPGAPPAAPAAPESNVSLLSGPDPSLAEDSAPEEQPMRLQPPFMGFEVFASMLGRVSDSSTYQRDRGTDMGYGAGVWYEGSDRLALGASYEYTGLGEGDSKTGGDYINAEYRVHGVWASGRAYPYRAGGLGVFATAGVGITFMRVSANGTRPTRATQPSESFLCSAGSTPNLAFAGGGGVHFEVGSQMVFLSQLGVAMYRGTSDRIGGCAPGLGSPVTVGVKLGFAYYFGV